MWIKLDGFDGETKYPEHVLNSSYLKEAHFHSDKFRIVRCPMERDCCLFCFFHRLLGPCLGHARAVDSIILFRIYIWVPCGKRYDWAMFGVLLVVVWNRLSGTVWIPNMLPCCIILSQIMEIQSSWKLKTFEKYNHVICQSSVKTKVWLITFQLFPDILRVFIINETRDW